ncbi:hypothetical protein JCM10212_002319 [Sporobolomyces blumeae]
MNLPAHETKHLAELDYVLPDGHSATIHQDNTSHDSTGRTVWLGAQVLSVYLHDVLASSSPFVPATSSNPLRRRRRRRVLDLGAGTGLVSLALASVGCDVLSTDLNLIVDGVLEKNVRANETVIRANEVDQPRLVTAVLDWNDPTNLDIRTRDDVAAERPPLGPPFDLIVTADTVYDADLSEPLLRTLAAMSSGPFEPPTDPDRGSSASPSTPPQIYLALERRDPSLVEAFLRSATDEWDFKCSKVDHARVRKLVENEAGGLGWDDESVWDGIEVWKLKLRKRRT